ncbi:MAG TPA: DUF1049 domain-containing protein [Nostocaceae cyanobacterium]|nr:DUF1049 domain-containing protein [Nostocaceae cyanobacterium]
MKNIASVLISLVIAGWVVAIALISVQNATPVSLRFLGFRSIQVPFGLMLAFFVAVGLISMTILQPLWAWGNNRSRYDEDAEFFVDDEDF